MRPGNKTGRLPDILYGIPVLLLIPFLIGVLAVSLFKRAEFCGYRFGDNPVWTQQNTILLIPTVAVMFGAFLLIRRVAVRLGRSGRSGAVRLVLYISFLVQMFFILFLPAKQFADQNAVNQIALDMINGKFTAFRKGGYLYQYPNNIGITLLLSLIYRVFPDTMLVPKLLNVAFSTLTTYLVFRIYEETHQEKDGRYGILIIAGFFPPMIMLNNLVYNDIIAAALFAGAVLETILHVKDRKWRHMALAGIYTVTGNFLRQVGIILIIAAALYLIACRTDAIKALSYFLIVFMFCKFPIALVNHVLLSTGKITEPIGMNSIPIHMWINMGMNEKKFGYWDNSQSLNIYLRQGGWDKEKSAEIYTSMIMDTIRDKGIPRIARIYLKKNAWLWSEGTYQAEYYGIGSWGYIYPTPLTRLMQDDWVARDCVRWGLHSMNYLLLALSCAGLTSSIRSKTRYQLILPAIVLIGFIGFYTIWEIKPRYIYLTYPYLILMAYHGLEYISGMISRLAGRASGSGGMR